MIYELEDTTKVLKLFEGWQDTLIYSCLQKVMGKIFVTDTSDPVSAYAYVGCFAFYAGKPDKELFTTNAWKRRSLKTLFPPLKVRNHI